MIIHYIYLFQNTLKIRIKEIHQGCEYFESSCSTPDFLNERIITVHAPSISIPRMILKTSITHAVY